MPHNSHPRRLLVVGCGYVGRALAELAKSAGYETGCAVATEESLVQLRRTFAVRQADVSDPDSVLALCDWWGANSCVVSCVSSGGGGVDAYRQVYLRGVHNLCEHFARCVFTSSTSVYAQTQGEVVDETSPAEPLRETGRILRRAEDHVLSRGGVVARLAGIYGPGRSAVIKKMLTGTATLDGDGSKIVNHIYQIDAARALLRLCASDVASEVYNVSDDMPLTQLELYQDLAAHLGRPLPERVAPDMTRKRGWTSKRVSNARMRALGWRAMYPSFLDAVHSDADLVQSVMG